MHKTYLNITQEIVSTGRSWRPEAPWTQAYSRSSTMDPENHGPAYFRSSTMDPGLSR